MKSEYGVDTIMEPLAGYNTARWAEGGWEVIDEATVRWSDSAMGSLKRDKTLTHTGHSVDTNQ